MVHFFVREELACNKSRVTDRLKLIRNLLFCFGWYGRHFECQSNFRWVFEFLFRADYQQLYWWDRCFSFPYFLLSKCHSTQSTEVPAFFPFSLEWTVLFHEYFITFHSSLKTFLIWINYFCRVLDSVHQCWSTFCESFNLKEWCVSSAIWGPFSFRLVGPQICGRTVCKKFSLSSFEWWYGRVFFFRFKLTVVFPWSLPFTLVFVIFFIQESECQPCELWVCLSWIRCLSFWC